MTRRAVLLVVLVVGAVLALGSWGGSEGRSGRGAEASALQATLGPLGVVDRRDEVRLRFAQPPRAGLLVDADTGAVLWRQTPERRAPIASLTKMMTALVAARELRPDDTARITREVLDYTGSGVGVLPRGREVRVETLLHGLMLASGNDAARALALRTAGSLRAFVGRMNTEAVRLGLSCTLFASVEGLSERNVSCPRDLAALAEHVLDTPRLARIVGRPRSVLPLQGTPDGKVYLYNHNPLVRERYAGVLGVKTGYTQPAGRCLVAAARRGGRRLVAVVLASPDPGGQARRLLDPCFAAIR